jgi:hypothetical protein
MHKYVIAICLWFCSVGCCHATRAARNTDDWYPFEATGLVQQSSVISLSDWLPKPAGKQGRSAIRGDQMLIDGRPVQFWGINNNYGDNAPPKDVAEARSRFYAKYGLNLVRMHKFLEKA